MASRRDGGSREGDADRGDGSESSTGLFSAKEADQGDLPRVSSVAQSGAQGDSLGSDRIPLRAGAAAAAADRPLARAARRAVAANEQRSSRERLTLIRIFEELRGLGYAGS